MLDNIGIIEAPDNEEDTKSGKGKTTTLKSMGS
jgi:hypothetical protein